MANLITNSGRALQTNLVSGLGGIAPKWMGLGSGTTAAAVTDTTLTTEYTTGTFTGYARVVTTPTRTTTSVTNDTISWVASWTLPSAESPAECGNFDQLALGGSLLDHSVFGAITGLGTGDVFQITKTLQYT